MSPAAVLTKRFTSATLTLWMSASTGKVVAGDAESGYSPIGCCASSAKTGCPMVHSRVCVAHASQAERGARGSMPLVTEFALQVLQEVEQVVMVHAACAKE